MSASGVCPWGLEQTRRAIMIRAVKPYMFEGARCDLNEPNTRCFRVLHCGGRCGLALYHVVPCECAGDDFGEPGTCPA